MVQNLVHLIQILKGNVAHKASKKLTYYNYSLTDIYHRTYYGYKHQPCDLADTFL